jgi:predicted NBD/HSP70 family sugar kinase
MHPQFEEPQNIRRRNRARLMALIFENPKIDRTQLASMIGVSNAAVSNISGELLEAGLIKEVEVVKNTINRGRKPVGLEINGHGGFVLGVNILATDVSIVLADICGCVIDQIDLNPRRIENPEKTLNEVKHAAEEILKKNKVPRHQLFGIGFGIAGFLDQSTGELKRAPYLGWPPFDLTARLNQLFDCELVVENVTRSIALAENRFGVLSSFKDLILIRSGLGLGGAFISERQLLEGRENFAGDIGHIFAERGGGICSCGKMGCLNTIASGWAVMHMLGDARISYATINQFRRQNARLAELVSDHAKGSAPIVEALSRASQRLAMHILPICQAYDPEAICLTGPLGRNEAYAKTFKDELFKNGLKCQIITASETKIISPAMAAVYLALSNIVYSTRFDFDQVSRGEAEAKVAFK